MSNDAVIEVMPDWLRDSHRAARNWGRYPLNGAQRYSVDAEIAAEIVEADSDQYDHVVIGADPADYSPYPG